MPLLRPRHTCDCVFAEHHDGRDRVDTSHRDPGAAPPTSPGCPAAPPPLRCASASSWHPAPRGASSCRDGALPPGAALALASCRDHRVMPAFVLVPDLASVLTQLHHGTSYHAILDAGRAVLRRAGVAPLSKHSSAAEPDVGRPLLPSTPRTTIPGPICVAHTSPLSQRHCCPHRSRVRRAPSALPPASTSPCGRTREPSPNAHCSSTPPPPRRRMTAADGELPHASSTFCPPRGYLYVRLAFVPLCFTLTGRQRPCSPPCPRPSCRAAAVGLRRLALGRLG